MHCGSRPSCSHVLSIAVAALLGCAGKELESVGLVALDEGSALVLRHVVGDAQGGTLERVDRAGRVRWSLAIPGVVSGWGDLPQVTASGRMATIRLSGDDRTARTIVGIDLETGDRRWTTELMPSGAAPLSSASSRLPSLRSGQLLLEASSAGQALVVDALIAESGERAWRLESGLPWMGGLLRLPLRWAPAADGVLFFERDHWAWVDRAGKIAASGVTRGLPCPAGDRLIGLDAEARVYFDTLGPHGVTRSATVAGRSPAVEACWHYGEHYALLVSGQDGWAIVADGGPPVALTVTTDVPDVAVRGGIANAWPPRFALADETFTFADGVLSRTPTRARSEIAVGSVYLQIEGTTEARAWVWHGASPTPSSSPADLATPGTTARHLVGRSLWALTRLLAAPNTPCATVKDL